MLSLFQISNISIGVEFYLLEVVVSCSATQYTADQTKRYREAIVLDHKSKDNDQMLLAYTLRSSSASPSSLNLVPIEDQIVAISTIHSLSPMEVYAMEQFQTRKMHRRLLGVFPKVTWARLVWNNCGAPKWIFILRLALLNRLYTKDRLVKWGVPVDQSCVLCDNGNETTSHLFFECDYSAQVWNAILTWLSIRRRALAWHEEVEWSHKYIKGKSVGSSIFRMALAACIYYLWQERNGRIFRKITTSSSRIIRLVIQEVVYSAHCKPKLVAKVADLNYYP